MKFQYDISATPAGRWHVKVEWKWRFSSAEVEECKALDATIRIGYVIVEKLPIRPCIGEPANSVAPVCPIDYGDRRGDSLTHFRCDKYCREWETRSATFQDTIITTGFCFYKLSYPINDPREWKTHDNLFSNEQWCIKLPVVDSSYLANFSGNRITLVTEERLLRNSLGGIIFVDKAVGTVTIEQFLTRLNDFVVARVRESFQIARMLPGTSALTRECNNDVLPSVGNSRKIVLPNSRSA